MIRYYFTIIILMSISAVSFASQETTVITDGAMVYKEPNFDAAVIAYLKMGQKVIVSDARFGQAFFRVALKPGVFGYISDVDVTAGKNKPTAAPGPTQAKTQTAEKPIQEKTKVAVPSSSSLRPAFDRKMFGLNVGVVNYSEIILKENYSEQALTYGLKYTAPFRLLTGPFVMDLNLLYHSGAPSYYNGLGYRSPTGYFVLGDLSILYQWLEFSRRKGFIYFGAGGLASFNYFLIDIKGSMQTLQETKLGGVGAAGIGYQWGSLVTKLEGRYYFEVSKYGGGLFSLQYAF